jgi:hypothetical protein
MTSSAVNDALAKRLRYLAPESRDERNGYIRLGFGEEIATSWGDVEPLGLSVRKAGLTKLLTLKKDAPPPEDADDVPLGTSAIPPGPPSLQLGADGYVMPTVIEALHVWAAHEQVAGVLDELLRLCPGYPGAPLVTEAQYQRFATRCQEAALAAADDVP